MGYLFDTNIFIRSKNEMPSDVWPTFWKKMSELINSGNVNTSEKVKEEIDRGKDDLTQWMKDNAPDTFYYSVDADVISKYKEVQDWASGTGRFTPSALSDFASVADAYLVATAAAKSMVVVTYETSDPNCKRRVKIPDACIAIGVRYCDLNTALKELGIQI